MVAPHSNSRRILQLYLPGEPAARSSDDAVSKAISTEHMLHTALLESCYDAPRLELIRRAKWEWAFTSRKHERPKLLPFLLRTCIVLHSTTAAPLDICSTGVISMHRLVIMCLSDSCTYVPFSCYVSTEE